MSKKAWIIFAAVCVALLGWLVYLSNKNRVSVEDVDHNTVLSATEASGNIGDHAFGKKDSKVVLVEYGDYQCPGCAQAYGPLKAASEKYEKQIVFVFRNFPLTTIHPNARAAAAAAEAAGLQGKFWEMHDKLYADQASWKDLDPDQRTSYFASLAGTLGLDVEKFKTDVASEKVGKKISYDIELGKKAQVTGTPAVFLDGKNIGNAWQTEDKLNEAIEKVLKEKGIELPKDKKDK